MKRLILILVAGLLSVVSAQPLQYELSPVIGSNTPESNYDLFHNNNTLKSHIVSGIELQFNQLPIIHPELSFTYATAEYDNTIETDIYRMSLNGVYQYDTKYVTPFLKMGLGLNMMSEPADYYTTFLDTGFGVKFNFNQHIGFKTEFISIVDYNNGDWNTNLTILAGLTLSFGTNEKREVLIYNPSEDDDIITNLDDEIKDDTTDMYEESDKENSVTVEENLVVETDNKVKDKVKEESVVEVQSNSFAIQEKTNVSNNDQDHDGINDYADKCIYTPPNTDVDSNGCRIDGDADGDGIKDSIDKCIYTPKGVRVYANGCRIDEDNDKDGIRDSIDECPNTPLNSIVNNRGCIQRDKNYKNIIQLNIEFKYKSFELTEISKEEVMMLADFLNSNKSYNIKVIGYTDNRGSRAYNKKLSQKRANAIKKMLIANNISAKRVSALGKGEENPIADNDTENGRAKNRRIEVELIKR